MDYVELSYWSYQLDPQFDEYYGLEIRDKQFEKKGSSRIRPFGIKKLDKNMRGRKFSNIPEIGSIEYWSDILEIP